MKPTWQLRACFEHFGAVCAHRYFSLSAISNDGKTVVVAMWEHKFDLRDTRKVYRSQYQPLLKGQRKGLSAQWIANLRWALDHCHGLVRVVVLQAEDVQGNPLVIKTCVPDDSLIMRITELDSKSGAFKAENT